MEGIQLTLILSILLSSFQYSHPTSLSDFNAGNRFQLPRNMVERTEPSATECDEEEKCINEGDDYFQIMPKAKAKGSKEKSKDVRFLYYVPGIVSYCEDLEPKWVLSGTFSGCLMTKLEIAGARRIGHVDTSKVAEAKCKTMMKRKYASRRETQARFFLPYDDKTKDEETKKAKFNKEINVKPKKKDPLQIEKPLGKFGLVDPDGKFYSFWAYQVDPEDEKNVWEILSKNPKPESEKKFSEIDETWNPS